MGERPGEFEIIEVLHADGDSLWADESNRPPLPFPSPRGGRRRWIVGAGIVAGLVVGGVVWSTDNSDREAAPTSTTIPSSTTTAPDGTLAPPAPSGRYLIEESADLVPYSADIDTPTDRSGVFELWSRSSAGEQWVSVQASPGTGEPYAFVDAVRRVSAGFDLVSPEVDPAITTVVVEREGWTLTIQAHDVPDDQIVQLASALRMIGRAVQDPSGVLPALQLGLTASAPRVEVLVYGDVETSAQYLTPDGGVVTLRVGAEAGDRAVRDRSLEYLATDIVRRGGQVRGRLKATGESFVLWDDEGRLLSLTGPLPPADLLSISKRVREATAQEWVAMVYGLRPNLRIGDYTALASDPSGWEAGMQLVVRGGHTSYLWWWTSPEGPGLSASHAVGGDPTAGSVVDTIVVRGATFVFVAVPADGDLDAATVVAADGTTVEIPLRLAFSDQAFKAGVARLDAPGPLVVTTST